MKLVSSLVAVSCAVALTACGTTVSTTGQAGVASEDGLGLAGVQQPGSAGNGIAGGQQPGGLVANGGSTTGNGVGSIPTPGSVTGPGTTVTGGKKTASPIKIGVVITETSNAAAFGVSAGNTYSERQISEAIIKGLNARGGLGGRKIVPVFAKTDTGSSNPQADFAAACEAFTTDNHVEAVLGYAYTFADPLENCLAKKRIPHLSTGFNVPDRQALASYPLFFALDVPTIDRRGLVKLEGAVADGVLTGKNKLGLVTDSCPATQRSLSNILLPRAKALGINVVKTVVISCDTSAAAAVSALQSAELQFASAGVDQVMFHAVSEGPPLLLFSQSANAQGYHPGYIMSSLGNLDALKNFLPQSAAKKVNGYGWMPTQDTPPGRYPKANALQNRCLGLLRANGISPKAGQDYYLSYQMCEAFFVYELALLKTAGSSKAGGIVAAVRSLGTSFASLTNQGGSLFSSSLPDAPRRARHVIYVESCRCFQYVGPARAIPTP